MLLDLLTSVTAIIDVYPRLRQPKLKAITISILSAALFLLGLPLTCPGGPYLINLLDNYAGTRWCFSISFQSVDEVLRFM